MAFTVSFDQSWSIRNVKTGGDLSFPKSQPTPLIKVNVYPQWFKQTTIDWSIPDSWGDCKFHVYYQFGPEGTYERLTSQPLAVPRLMNNLSRETSKFRSEYYVVEAILPSGDLFRSFPTQPHTRARDTVARKASEIQRREFMLLTKFTGVRSYYFKRRYYGERCPRCWNAAQEKVVDDKCTVCLGTSFKGGYYDPVPTYLQYEPTVNTRPLGYNGRMEPNQIGAWTISLPEMVSGDVIIRSGDWNVYVVTRSAPTELRTNPVRQTLLLTQLNRADIENELMSRQVTDDFGTYLESLGGPFSHKRFPRDQINTSPSDDLPWDESNKDSQIPVKYRL